MKKLIAIVLAVALLAVLVPGIALAGKDVTGNGCPSGPHYNLNIIGVDNPKNANFDGGNGHRIFVQLGKKNETKRTVINLVEGDFAVTDVDGTDGYAAFQLPNPDPTNSGTTEYSVYIRVLGKPGGKIKMTTCATDPVTGEEVCSDLQVIEVRDSPAHGKNKFNNVCAELLYIYAWVWNEAKGEYEYMRVPLFSALLEEYLWKYDNNGCKLAQLRFYPGVATEVPKPEDVPHLTEINPSSGAQGTTNLNITITGANVDLSANGGVKKADVSFGDLITVNSVSVDSATQLTVNISIDGAATTGWRKVSVTLADGTTLTIPFEVTLVP